MVPIIDMMDNPRTRGTAFDRAHLALDRSDRFARVMLVSIISTDPVVEVIAP